MNNYAQPGDAIPPSVSIVVPAYNASRTLVPLIERFPPDLWRAIKNIWIINDGSDDTTGSVIDALAKEHKAVRPVHFEKNRGYGGVLKKGLALCRDDGCDFAACVHADGQYPPESVLLFVKTMAERNIDLMQGSRLAGAGQGALRGGMPLYKYIAGKILVMMENVVFGLRMTDYHSGFLIYSRKCLNAFSLDRLSASFDFDLEMIALARANGLQVGELPIPTRYAGERSYLNPVGYGLRVLRVMAKYLARRYH
jgi:glycosyltransferase involved in cell wall biosynthesis